MKNANERKKIVKELLDLTDREFTDEELIHELISTKVTKKGLAAKYTENLIFCSGS